MIAGPAQAAGATNGVETRHSFDALDRLAEVRQRRAGVTLGGVSYTVDRIGNRLSIADLASGAGGTVARTYAYDKLYRLKAETLTGDPAIAGSLGYHYDRVGNRLHRTSTLPQLPPQTQIVDANDRLTDRPFDANGNTIETTGTLPGERLFNNYDSEDRLTRRESSVAGVVAEYRYDGDGNRVEERTPAGTIRFLVDTQNHTGYAQVLEEKSPSGNLLRSYAYGLDLIAQHDSTSTHYFGYDGLGTTRLLTDVNGNVSDRFWYDAFGTLLKREGTTDTRYLYTGEQYDAALGMYYLRARYLEAGNGRFWTRDIFEGWRRQPASRYPYVYSGGNPVGATDPSGYVSEYTLSSLNIAGGVQGRLKAVLIHSIRSTIGRWDTALCNTIEVIDTAQDLKDGLEGLYMLTAEIGGVPHAYVGMSEDLNNRFRGVGKNDKWYGHHIADQFREKGAVNIRYSAVAVNTSDLARRTGINGASILKIAEAEAIDWVWNDKEITVMNRSRRGFGPRAVNKALKGLDELCDKVGK